MRFITADYIIPVSSETMMHGVVVVEDGRIMELTTRNQCPADQLEYYKGIVIPGFVNAHCHLELSHMKGVAATGTGLISFISNVVRLRDYEEAVIRAAIKSQDEKMYAAGIQAVGDISNKTDTADQKSASPIRYYTFVEMFDFLQDKLTAATIENYRKIYQGQSGAGKNRKSYVPHAPYSVSKGLFDFINGENGPDTVISIHNQETPDEDQLFTDGSGGFKSFFNGFGFDMEEFEPTGQSSIRYALQHMRPAGRNLFVHNTMTGKSDIEAAHAWSDRVYWVTCPNANLYIENRLPDYSRFIEAGAKMAIGTDSIMSNWQLSVWEEIKTIKKYQSYVPLAELVRWGTLNGAEALGFEEEIGSLDAGKEPGLVHIELDWQGEETRLEGSRPVRIL